MSDVEPPPATPAATQSQLWFMVRALRHRNYRLFFVGQIVSLVGTWMSSVASGWLVYELAKHEHPDFALLLMGIVAFSGQIPIFLLAPFAGVWVDRWNRQHILMGTQALSMVQSLAIAALVLSGWINIPLIIALNVFQGLVNAFDIPARQAFVVEIVEDRTDLSNAIALNSSMFHLARLLGPLAAGLLMSTVGIGICFLIDGISFFSVLLALSMMRVTPRVLALHQPRMWSAFREGCAYAFGFAPVWTLLVMVAVTSLMAMSQNVLMPIFADKVLAGTFQDSEITYGFLAASSGVGALLGSLYLASRRTVVGLGNVIALACGGLGIALICFAFSRTIWLSVPILILVGFSMVVQMASCNTLLQIIVDDDKRGRVMSLLTMAFMGMAPFGSLLAGSVANYWGAPITTVIAGSGCVIAAAVFASRLAVLRPLVHPIYVQKGILPK